MEKIIKDHLESITAKNLEDSKHEAFMSMASCNLKHGNYSLGVNGMGWYVVKANKETYLFQTPSDAVEKYKECVSNLCS